MHDVISTEGRLYRQTSLLQTSRDLSEHSLSVIQHLLFTDLEIGLVFLLFLDWLRTTLLGRH